MVVGQPNGRSDLVLFAQPCLFGVLGICLPLNRQRPDYYHPDQSCKISLF
jgi:hypothetical protein